MNTLRSLKSRGYGEDLVPLLEEVTPSLEQVYGFLDMLCCLMSRGEFDTEQEVVQITNLSLKCLHSCALKSLEFLRALSFHKYASFDIALAQCRGVVEDDELATALLRKMMALNEEGVKRGILDALMAKAFSNSIINKILYSQVQMKEEDAFSEEDMFFAEVKRLTRASICVWETLCDDSFPQDPISAEKQQENYKRVKEIAVQAKMASGDKVKALNQEQMRIVLNVSPDFIDHMIVKKVFSESSRFGEEVHKCDAQLSELEEFQAGRNVWAAFGLQLTLLESEADCNSAIRGYSMLYPYSDNFLDAKDVALEEKNAFQEKFRTWLAKGDIDEVERPKGRMEEEVLKQVKFVEETWDRTAHPTVFFSLLAIHDAQTVSMEQHCNIEDASFSKILEITCFKGGTSVLADLYCAAGNKVHHYLLFCLAACELYFFSLLSLIQNTYPIRFFWELLFRLSMIFKMLWEMLRTASILCLLYLMSVLKTSMPTTLSGDSVISLIWSSDKKREKSTA